MAFKILSTKARISYFANRKIQIGKGNAHFRPLTGPLGHRSDCRRWYFFAGRKTASAGETFASKIKTPLMNFIIAGLTGTDVQLGRPDAGPALVISLIPAVVAGAFAAFCFAELAAVIPVSESAYTYSYATRREIFAWIISWPLILEYAASKYGGGGELVGLLH